MMIIKPRNQILVLLFLVLLTSVSCLAMADGTDGFIRLASSGAPKTLDPATDGIILNENACIYETLVGVSSDLQLVPILATSWKQTDDTTWEFIIRDGVKFHDGSPLTAEDVKISLDKAAEKNPKVKTMLKYASSEVKGEKSLIVHTTEKNAVLPTFFTYPNTAVISKSSFDTSGDVKQAIGTGMMKLKDFDVTTGTITVEKNPTWWGGEVACPGIIITKVAEPNTRSLAIENKEFDITYRIAASEAARLKEVEGLSVQMYDGQDFVRLDCNLDHPVMADKNIRTAISDAIDRTGIADNVLFGTATPAAGVFNPIFPWANPSLKTLPYDVEKAKQLLDEAGCKDTDNDGIREKDGQPLEFTLVSNSGSATLPAISEAIADNLKDIGILVNVELMEYGACDEKLKTGNWDLHLRAYSTCMVPDPSYVMTNWYTSTGSDNYAGYSNPDFDAKVKAANGISEQSKRYRAYDDVQQIVYEDLPLIPVVYQKFIMVLSDQVKGYVYDPTGHDVRMTPETHL